MSEENQNVNSETEVKPTAQQMEQAAPEESTQEVKPVAEPAPQPEPTPTQPQVIIQKERGFAHYVGFALLCVVCIAFFFIPGIAVTFGVSRLVALGGAAAWIFSAILSLVMWLVFKMKIKGFKKSFYAYIALCVVVLAGLIAGEVLTENYNLFSNILALLTGGAA